MTRTPPVVRVTLVEKSKAAPFNKVRIRVEAVDQGDGVGEVLCFKGRSGLCEKRVALDGGLATSLRPGDAGRVKGVEFSALLHEGENPLWVTATSTDHGWEAEPVPIIVTYDRPKLAAPRLYVLSVGIQRYNEPLFGTLRYPVSDARAVAELCERRGHGGLFKEVHVEKVLDGEATREAILGRIKALGSRTGPQDTMVVYLSGHGLTLADKGPAAGRGEEYYFVTVDVPASDGAANPDGLRRLGLPASDLLGAMAAVPAENTALILDTCHAGAAIRR